MSAPAAPPPLSPPETSLTYRRVLVALSIAAVFALAYVLRGVLVPLFFAFLLAYALDPFVDWLAERHVPRGLAAVLVMLGIAGLFTLVLVFAVPMFVDELHAAAADLPMQLKGLEQRLEPWLWQTF